MNDQSPHPAELLIEVKCSRRDRFSIKPRDLKGLESTSSFGLLAALVTFDAVEGPYWVFVPVDKVCARQYTGKALAAKKIQWQPLQEIGRLWGDVLLDDEFIGKLTDMKIDLKSQEWWKQLPFHPKATPHDAIRKVKVAEALTALRGRLDSKYKQGSAARREGFLHQCILCYCFNRLGHSTISNNSGVPDLRTSISFSP